MKNNFYQKEIGSSATAMVQRDCRDTNVGVDNIVGQNNTIRDIFLFVSW